MTTRAAIYVRISEDREGAGLGVERQTQDCRQLAESLGAGVVTVFTDNDISASKGKVRPAYERMLTDIARGAVDLVVAWHPDRLHRSPSELERYVEVCAVTPTHTVKAGLIDLSTASGRMVARILGATSRHEVEHMAERQRRKQQQKADAGQWKGGRRPFGYEADGVTIVDSEAKALRQATKHVLAGGSLYSVAREWNHQGITTSTGKSWRPVEVRRVLARPRNAGLMEHHGQVIGRAQWPAAVDPVEWSALTALLSDPERRTTTGPTRKWLGSGLYMCDVCQEAVITTLSNGIRVYRCRKGCVAKAQSEVDALIHQRMAALLPGKTIPTTDNTRDLTHDRARASAIRNRLNVMAALFGQGVIDAEQLASGSLELRQELEEVQERLHHAMSGVPAVLAGDLFTSWAKANLEGKRTILALLFTITITKTGRGRPKGWVKGQSYFRPDAIKVGPTQLGWYADKAGSVGLVGSVDFRGRALNARAL